MVPGSSRQAQRWGQQIPDSTCRDENRKALTRPGVCPGTQVSQLLTPPRARSAAAGLAIPRGRQGPVSRGAEASEQRLRPGEQAPAWVPQHHGPPAPLRPGRLRQGGVNRECGAGAQGHKQQCPSGLGNPGQACAAQRRGGRALWAMCVSGSAWAHVCPRTSVSVQAGVCADAYASGQRARVQVCVVERKAWPVVWDLERVRAGHRAVVWGPGRVRAGRGTGQRQRGLSLSLAPASFYSDSEGTTPRLPQGMGCPSWR